MQDTFVPRQDFVLIFRQQITITMSKVQIKSIFEQIAEQVFNMTDVNQAKLFITNFVSEKNIKDRDKASIIRSVNDCKQIYRIHLYISNSLLKYEGLGIK